MDSGSDPGRAPSLSTDLEFQWNGHTLAGTLHRPEGPDPHPCVLMMQGSGPADRDNDGYFLPIRETFLRMGIAAFSFDKPGCGDSTGDWRHNGLEGRADQATTALGFLKAQPSIDAERVGVWGQSQGGWLAQMLASRRSDLAFAIANSGPSIGVAEQNEYGCEHTMRAQGHGDDAIRLALAFLAELHDAARDGVTYDEVERRLLQDARDEPWYGYVTVDDAGDWAQATKFVSEDYQPLEAMSRIECSFLAIYGGRDVLVPAWRSAEESGKALEQAGASDATVIVFPNGDHRIQVGTTAEFATGYLDLLGDWAARRVRR